VWRSTTRLQWRSKDAPLRTVAVTTAAEGLLAGCVAVDRVCGSRAAPLAHVGRPTPVVLVLRQTRGYHHASIPWAVAAVRRVAARDGRDRVVFLSSAARLGPAVLRRAAVVMFLLTSGELPLSQSEKRALVAYVHGGGGLLGFHSATDTFHRWPA